MAWLSDLYQFGVGTVISTALVPLLWQWGSGEKGNRQWAEGSGEKAEGRESGEKGSRQWAVGSGEKAEGRGQKAERVKHISVLAFGSISYFLTPYQLYHLYHLFQPYQLFQQLVN